MDIFRRLTEDEVKLNLEILKDIEKKYKFNFPEKFIFFHQLFKTGQYFENWPGYIDKDFRIFPLCSIYFVKDNLKVPYGCISNPNQIKGDIELDLNENPFGSHLITSLFEEYKIIRIGDIILRGGLFLGFGVSNADKIYIIGGEYNEPHLISNSIIEYYNGLQLTDYKDGYQNFYKSLTDKYYKNDSIKLSINQTYLDKIEKFNISNTMNPSMVNFKELMTELNMIFDNYKNI